MTDYKKDARIWTFNVEITNRVPVHIKTNDWKFAKLWLSKQLAPLKERLPEDATFEVKFCTVDKDNNYDAEVYTDEDGKPIEETKNTLFKEKNETSSDS